MPYWMKKGKRSFEEGYSDSDNSFGGYEEERLIVDYTDEEYDQDCVDRRSMDAPKRLLPDLALLQRVDKTFDASDFYKQMKLLDKLKDDKGDAEESIDLKKIPTKKKLASTYSIHDAAKDNDLSAIMTRLAEGVKVDARDDPSSQMRIRPC